MNICVGVYSLSSYYVNQKQNILNLHSNRLPQIHVCCTFAPATEPADTPGCQDTDSECTPSMEAVVDAADESVDGHLTCCGCVTGGGNGCDGAGGCC